MGETKRGDGRDWVPPSRGVLHGLSKKPVAALLLGALGIGSTPLSALAATIVVNRCNDQDGISYFGYSLRKAISAAEEGDTVDLSGLSCSTITLERGELYAAQNSLDLLGPAGHTLTIDANGASRVLNHEGTGVLRIDHIAFANGLAEDGAGIRSNGSLVLRNSVVSGCTASGRGGATYAATTTVKYSDLTDNSALIGGAIYGESITIRGVRLLHNAASYKGGGVASSGKGNLLIYDSGIFFNKASVGGGIHVGFQPYSDYPGELLMYDSTVGYNNAGGGGGIWGMVQRITRSDIYSNYAEFNGGGTLAYSLHMAQSTFRSNFAGTNGGGIDAQDATIINSTVSGNSSAGDRGAGAGGIFAGHWVTVKNSTVAFNANLGSAVSSAGGIVTSGDVVVISSILAKNSAVSAGGAADISAGSLVAGASIIMSSNIITASITADPLLQPLAYNGGIGPTHALSLNSPALNAGTNPDSLETDQRGLSRVAGNKTDIGSYELQPSDDRVFASGFE